ncbi:MAG: RNA polymerase sigma factor [Archangium sp.]|nr:RNA polymerase sigma factor [Archangium sp.]
MPTLGVVSGAQQINEILGRLADGDRTAVAPLFEALWPVLFGYALRNLGDRASAEDAAQEAFVKLCAQAGDFDRARDGTAWALHIASFEIRTQRQRVARRRETVEPVEAAHEEPGAEAALELRQAERAFDAAFAQLSVADRDALGTVDGPASPAQRKRRQRALERLRVIWRSLYGES